MYIKAGGFNSKLPGIGHQLDIYSHITVYHLTSKRIVNKAEFLIQSLSAGIPVKVFGVIHYLCGIVLCKRSLGFHFTMHVICRNQKSLGYRAAIVSILVKEKQRRLNMLFPITTTIHRSICIIDREVPGCVKLGNLSSHS